MIEGGIFTRGEYSHACRLRVNSTCSARRMRTHVANATVSKSVHRLGAKKKDFREGNPSFFGRSGGTRTHGLQYPKLARYHLRYASKRIKTIEFCCGQLCGQHRNLTDFSEWVKCKKSSVFKGFQRFCAHLVEQETTSTRNWRATNCATPRNEIFTHYSISNL